MSRSSERGARRRSPTKQPLCPVTEFLERPSGSGPLLARLRQHAALRHVVQSRLPAFLAEHCLACVGRDDLLTVFTDSAAWATQLRFALPGLLPDVQARSDPRLRRAQVRVLLPIDPVAARPPSSPARRPGHTVVSHLQQAADHCATPELRSALLRLAATCGNLSPD